MKNLKINFLFLFCLVLVGAVSATDYYSNSNKTLFVFPKHASLGGAGLVFSRDAAPQSNPANLPLDTFSQIALSYAGYYNNALSTTFASFVTQVTDKISLGMFAGYLFIPDIEVTAQLEKDSVTEDPIYDPSRIEIETSSETLFNFSLGYSILNKRFIHLSAGASLHCQRRRLIDWTGYGIGLDAGVTAMFPLNGLRVSLFADDITTNYIHWSSDYHDNSLPHVRLGIGWRKDLPDLYSRISIMYKSPDLLSNDGVGYNLFGEKSERIDEPYSNRIKDDPLLLLTSGCYGIEYVIYKIVALRLGLDEPKRIFFGSGVNLFAQKLSFEFSLSGLVKSYELESIYYLSISYKW